MTVEGTEGSWVVPSFFLRFLSMDPIMDHLGSKLNLAAAETLCLHVPGWADGQRLSATAR